MDFGRRPAFNVAEPAKGRDEQREGGPPVSPAQHWREAARAAVPFTGSADWRLLGAALSIQARDGGMARANFQELL